MQTLQKWLLVSVMLVLVGTGCTNSPPTLRTEFSAEERAVWRELVKWPESCEEDFNVGIEAGLGGLALYSYSPTESILRVTCGVYAYQTAMLFYHVTTNGAETFARQLTVPTYDSVQQKIASRVYEYEDDIVGSVLGFDSFNLTKNTLTILTKDRGVGDCGTYETFTIGSELALVKAARQTCEAADEFRLENPNVEEMPAWPVLYEKK